MGHVSRTPGMGLFFDAKEILGFDLFRPQFTGLTLCRDSVKRFIEGKGYNNIQFLEVGDAVEAGST